MARFTSSENWISTSFRWTQNITVRCEASSRGLRLAMTKKLFSKHQPRSAAGDMRRPGMVIASTIFMLLWASGAAAGGEAPQWMHALTSVPLPAHSNKADALLLYSETNVTVLSADKVRAPQRGEHTITSPLLTHVVN